MSKREPKTLLTTIFVLVCYGLSSGQGIHVRTTTNFLNPTNSTTITSTFGAASTTGNLIVVHLSYSGQTINVSSITDTKLNTYSRINGPTNWNGANFRSELWYAFNITGGAGAITVTATLTGAPINTGGLKFSQIYISEFSGIKTTNPLDQKSVTSGTAIASSTFNSGSVTTLYSNELIYGGAIGGTAGTINAGATFTSISAANSNLIEFKNNLAAGSASAVFNSTTAGTYVADMATFITTGSVLPVTLVNFEAYVSDKGVVELEWITSSERNSDYFEVQRSNDGKEWNVIGRLKAAGNSVSLQQYKTADVAVEAGVNYYRLDQADLDGRHEYSPVREVRLISSDESGIHFYPNPVSDWLFVDGTQDDIRNISIFNAMGMNMKITEVVRRNTGISFNLSSFPVGLYLIKSGTTNLKFYKE